MRNCVFMNCKGFSVEQAITALNDQLTIFYKKPENIKFNVHQVIITTTVELPVEGRIASALPKPQVVFNITCVLMEEDQERKQFVDSAIQKIEQLIASFLPYVEQKKNDDQIEEFFSKEDSRHPDCKHLNVKNIIYKRDRGGYWGRFASCTDCGSEVWLGVLSPKILEALNKAESKGLTIINATAEFLGIKDEPELEPGDSHTELVIDKPGPIDQQEVEKIKQAAALFCQHERLKPAKYSKAHRTEGDYYQICEDCGAEVWASGSVFLPSTHSDGNIDSRGDRLSASEQSDFFKAEHM